MTFQRFTATGLAFCCCLSIAAGCGASGPESDHVFAQDGTYHAAYTDTALHLDYDTPVARPRIIVNQTGYRPQDEKTALFYGDVLPERFTVVDAQTLETVYTGEVVRTSNAEEIGGTGTFSEVTSQGTYYIHADIVGDSYAFSIREDVYEDAFTLACKQFYLNRCGTSITEQYAGEAAHSVCHSTPAHLEENASAELDVTGGWHLDARANRTVIDGCRAADQMLLAYEMQPEAFPDDIGIPESGNHIPDLLDEVRYEVQWLLKMQDDATGGVYAAAVTDVEEGGNPLIANVSVTPITMEATIAFASTLAKFSYLYQSYDADFATVCIQASDRAFRLYAAAQQEITGAQFRTACELYRATGESRYADVIRTFFQEEAFAQRIVSEEDPFFGAVAYLSTTGNVDTEACNRMMEAFMEEARRIAADANASDYGVAVTAAGNPGADKSDAASRDVAKRTSSEAGIVLRNMRLLGVVNHILYNYEYKTILEHHAHYLMGRNPASADLVSDDTEHTYRDEGETGVRSQPALDAQWILLLSAVMF